MLAVFPPRRFSSQGRRPQNGSASTVKLNYFIVRCGNRSNRIAVCIPNTIGGSGGEHTIAAREIAIALSFPLRCARIPPDSPEENLNAEASAYRFAVPDCAHPVLGAKPKVHDEKNSGAN